MSKVNVYGDDERKVIARVEYNNNLDHWDGRNWTSGSTGRHKGLTRLKNGQFVLIEGSDWQGDKNYGELITKIQALQLILGSGNDELLDKFGLREEAEKKLLEEE